jgi:hypothetical protein
MIVLSTPAQIDAMRMFSCLLAIKMHIESNGTMRLTRMATPATLRAIASEYTGVTYPRSKKGMLAAFNDLTELKRQIDEAIAKESVNV